MIAWLVLEKLGRRVRQVGLRRIVSKIGRYALRSSPLTVPMVVGFAFMEQYVAYLGTPLFLWVGFGLVGVVAVRAIVLRRRAQHSIHGIHELNAYSFSLSRSMGVGFNFVIGGVLKAFVNLALGLLPSLSNPWVLLILGIYAMFLASVVLMKRISSRLGGKYRRNLPRGIWT